MYYRDNKQPMKYTRICETKNNEILLLQHQKKKNASETHKSKNANSEQKKRELI